ncbi:MAG: thiamine phosphate synthase [Phycisphaerae bacterium]|nr:thiamine phosphate synthase [Phycisphaerae bacterium]
MDPGVARILDANFNRAREALRTLEDYARFSLDDATAAETAKSLRHDLAAAMAELPSAALLDARDVAGDVGTAIRTAQEGSRDRPEVVALAAARRAGEALRVLEEYGKLAGGGASPFERIRYGLYELEQRVSLLSPRLARLSRARLHVLLTEARCARPWLETAAAALDGGADVLQFREKALPDREVLARAERLVELARPRGALVIVNDRADLARLSDADGVHLGQDDLPIAAARRIIGRTRLVGCSTHSLEQVRAADADAPDYVAVGPMFASATKPAEQIPGPSFAAQAAALTRRPMVAIGGITPERIDVLVRAGVRCVAVCQAVIAAADPARASREILASLPPPQSK